MHGGIWPKEQMGQMLNLGAREVLNETWTALAARNGRPLAFDTTRLVGMWLLCVFRSRCSPGY
jgi:hypothetical protein